MQLLNTSHFITYAMFGFLVLALLIIIVGQRLRGGMPELVRLLATVCLLLSLCSAIFLSIAH